jgi:hypothetical protein
MNANTTAIVAFFASISWIAWAAAFAWSRWLVRPRRDIELAARARDDRLEQRLAGIEQTMQAMVTEVERLGEGQRLTTRLLADRQNQSAAVPRLADEPRRVDTPH